MSEQEIKEIIKCLHKLWYQENPHWLDDASLALKVHRHLEALFNYADITDTLVENNPSEVSPTQFKKITGAKE